MISLLVEPCIVTNGTSVPLATNTVASPDTVIDNVPPGLLVTAKTLALSHTLVRALELPEKSNTSII